MPPTPCFSVFSLVSIIFNLSFLNPHSPLSGNNNPASFKHFFILPSVIGSCGVSCSSICDTPKIHCSVSLDCLKTSDFWYIIITSTSLSCVLLSCKSVASFAVILWAVHCYRKACAVAKVLMFFLCSLLTGFTLEHVCYCHGACKCRAVGEKLSTLL